MTVWRWTNVRSVLHGLLVLLVGAALLVPVDAHAVPQAARDKAAQEAEAKRRAAAERQRQQAERTAAQQRAARQAADRAAQAEASRRQAAAEARAREESAARAEQDRLKANLGLGMALVPAGCFQMGSNTSGQSDEQPQHQVCIPRAFGMGKHEVTFDEYDRFVTATGAARPADQGWGRGTRPVINVSWEEARRYAQWLSSQTGKRFRLPSEAEWEYATRAGTSTEYWWGNAIGSNRANCDGCGSGFDNQKTAPVGSFEANPWGLHDVHGNVWEWVQDCYEPTYGGAPTDGRARDGGGCSTRVLRGGSWFNIPSNLRSADRDMNAPDNRIFSNGFRLAQDL